MSVPKEANKGPLPHHTAPEVRFQAWSFWSELSAALQQHLPVTMNIILLCMLLSKAVT